MAFQEQALVAHLHKEVYIVLLKSALRERGTRRRIARQLGVYESHLHYLLDPLAYSRTRSTALLERVAALLPMEAEQRRIFLEHVVLAREADHQYRDRVRSLLRDGEVDALLQGLREAHEGASFAASPERAQVQYRLLRDASKALIATLGARQHPLALVEASLLLHDAQCVLNRPDDALLHAMLAEQIMNELDREDYPRDAVRFDHYRVNTLLAQGLAYHNLHLEKDAWLIYNKAEWLINEEVPQQAAFWRPHLSRMQINSIVGKGRFTAGEVVALGEEASRVAERRNDEYDPLLRFLVGESVGRALTLYGGPLALREANRRLSAQMESIESVPHIGPLHRAIFYRTFARLRRVQGDDGEHGDRKSLVILAMRTALDAGLEHQVQALQSEFPTDTELVIRERVQPYTEA